MNLYGTVEGGKKGTVYFNSHKKCKSAAYDIVYDDRVI